MKFDEIRNKLIGVGCIPYNIIGDCSETEAKILYDLAYGGLGEGYIVEIGTYHGLSTIFLANGSKEARRERVVTIDNFSAHGGFHNAKSLFDNLKEFGVLEDVVVVKDTSWEFAKIWNKRIRLLYIDGGHSLYEVKRDFESFEPFVVKSGVIVLHDTGEKANNEGPAVFVRNFLENMKDKFKIENLETGYGITIAIKMVD